MSAEISFTVELNAPYEEAIEAVTAALKTEGFGVLTRIDVKATLKEKMGQEFRPYIIMGACNPPLAHRALEAASQVGMMLPCNVTVEAVTEETSRVHIANPQAMMLIGSFSENLALKEVAEQAGTKLSRVANALQGG